MAPPQPHRLRRADPLDPSTLTPATPSSARTDRAIGCGSRVSVSLGYARARARPATAWARLFETAFPRSSIFFKQQQAQAITNQVLMGDNDQLHQSVIAMQEASVAFSLMVEVRNKLVDSYQELMRMPA